MHFIIFLVTLLLLYNDSLIFVFMFVRSSYETFVNSFVVFLDITDLTIKDVAAKHFVRDVME